MEKIKDILLYLWQLPQNLLGWLLVKILGAQYLTMRQCKPTGTFVSIYSTPKMQGGISLGKYIVINDKHIYHNTVHAHEAGHCVQSIYLGWLYLIVIGIPSGIWCWIYDNFDIETDYYSFYTERWAERIAGIKRD